MNKLFLFLVLFSLILGCQKPHEKSDVVLAIFAHPDDETTIAPILSKFAEASEVYLVIATDGRYGVTHHAQIPAGDSLIQIRTKELICSCNAMGIHPPIQLGLLDGLGSDLGMNPYHEQLAILEEKITHVIDSIHPNAIITFGPDGDTGHPDHRMVSTVVTEILLKSSADKIPNLYYMGWTEKQAAKYKGWNLNYLDESHLNIEISFDDTHKEQYYKSIQCYTSQYPPEEIKEWINFEKKDQDNRLFFRQLHTLKKKRTSF